MEEKTDKNNPRKHSLSSSSSRKLSQKDYLAVVKFDQSQTVVIAHCSLHLKWDDSLGNLKQILCSPSMETISLSVRGKAERSWNRKCWLMNRALRSFCKALIWKLKRCLSQFPMGLRRGFVATRGINSIPVFTSKLTCYNKSSTRSTKS